MEKLSLFDIPAVVLMLAAIFGYINHRWLKFPQTIGLVVISLLASVGVAGVDALFPDIGVKARVRNTLEHIDFENALMNGMLCFLLFAGALHVSLKDLADLKWTVGWLAPAGVMMSTALVGVAIYYALRFLGFDVSLMLCLAFGALISATDPIAVLGILKFVKVPASLEATIAGESLFNDGVSVVIFTLLIGIAIGTDGHAGDSLSLAGAAGFFLREVGGGALFGVVGGYVAYRAMKSADDYNLAVLITLAMVTFSYSAALAFHVSGPIAVVVAGLLIGNYLTLEDMSETTRDYLNKFWSLIDEVLNAILFLLIGFEIIALNITVNVILITVIAIPIVIGARFISVGLSIKAFSRVRRFADGTIPILTWGGLRGGISVALALSLPDIPAKEAIIAVTYGVVIFSIVVQGLTFKKLVQVKVA